MTDLERRKSDYSVPRVAQRRSLDQPRSADIGAWEETVRQAKGGQRIALSVAGVLIVICAAQAAAIALMLPLREIVPYTILVDRQTGYVETARGLQLGDLAEDQAVVQAMAAQYVLARETFDPADFEERYNRVAMWSIGPARDLYVAQYQPGGDLLGDIRAGTRIDVTVKRIDLLDKDTASVRFETRRRDPGAEGPARMDWQAVISFRFTGSPMKMSDRLLNPLGFQVTAYRRDQEAPTPPLPPVEAPETPGVAATAVIPAPTGLDQPVASDPVVGDTQSQDQTAMPETPLP